MSVKQKTLEVLENNRGQYISGGELAATLKVSRNAVWKAIKSLEKEGYVIDAIKNRGYRLAQQNDILSVQGIQKYLEKYADEFLFDIRKSVTSTNKLLKEEALEGAKEGRIIIAEEQTSGKGKTEQGFISPKGTGIYMSVLVRPNCYRNEIFPLTIASAVAVAEAIEEVSNRKAQIQWVNDVYCDDKKVSGILTEASFQVETGKMNYLIVGIGIHVKMPEKATLFEEENGLDCVFEQTETDVRSQLVAEVLMRFWFYYKNLEKKVFIDAYRQRAIFLERRVKVQNQKGTLSGKAVGINEDCHLLLEKENGIIEEITDGMIQLL